MKVIAGSKQNLVCDNASTEAPLHAMCDIFTVHNAWNEIGSTWGQWQAQAPLGQRRSSMPQQNTQKSAVGQLAVQ